MTALVATLGAALYGLADFLGGLASRRDSALAVTIAVQATGLVLLLALSVFFPPASWTDPRILWGMAAGTLGGTGVLALYAGLATGRMSVVAPITAALAAAVPAAVGFARGESLSWMALTGMALAFVAVIVVSVFAEDEGHGDTRKALVFAVISGLGFGFSILCWAQTPASTWFAPLVIARLTSVAIFSAAALLTRGQHVLVGPETRSLAMATGVVDALANSAQVASLRMGPVALAAVIGALYPVGTILLARFYLHEHLRGWQRVGIVMALAAVVLSAAP